MSTNQKNISSALYLILLCLAIATFPFSSKVYFISIIIAILLWLIRIRENRIFLKNHEINLHYSLLLAPYLLMILGLLYSNNQRQGLKELETASSFIALPFLILYAPLEKRKISLIKYSFISSITIITVFCFYHIFQKAKINNHTVTDFFSSYLYQTEYFTEPFNIHPTYMSLFIGVCTLCCFYELFQKRLLSLKISLIVCILLLSTANLLLVSRGGLIALGIAGFYILFFTLNLKYKVLVFAFLLFTLPFLSNLIYGFNKFFEPFTKGIESFSEYNPKSSANLHIQSWKCSIEILDYKKLLFGSGTGDELDDLYECYQSKGFDLMVSKKLNAHNQYLSSLIRNGLVGLLLLTLCFFASLKKAIQNKSILFTAFIIMIVSSALFESTLNVYRGIVLFSFFNALFLKEIITQKQIIKQE